MATFFFIGKTACLLAAELSKGHLTTRGRSRSDMKSLPNIGIADGPTEAAQGMIDYAFSHQEVRGVIAHTLAQTNASNRVLQKVGMKFIAEVDDPEEGEVWRWQISRDEYHSA